MTVFRGITFFAAGPASEGNRQLPKAMKTHVEFRSDAFPPYDGEEDEINPGRYGKRLAEFLVRGLKDKGFEALDPVKEDWGCVVPIKNDASTCGSDAGTTTNAPTMGSSASSNPTHRRFGVSAFGGALIRPQELRRCGKPLTKSLRQIRQSETKSGGHTMSSIGRRSSESVAELDRGHITVSRGM
jgi:hypothetical protein